MTENLRHDQEWWKFMEHEVVPYLEFQKRGAPEDEEVIQVLGRFVEKQRKALLERPTVSNRPSESDKRFDMFIDLFLKMESGVKYDDAIESVAKRHEISSRTIEDYFYKDRYPEERDSALQLAQAIINDPTARDTSDMMIAISRSESRTTVTDFAQREELRKLYPRAVALLFQQEFLRLYPPLQPPFQ